MNMSFKNTLKMSVKSIFANKMRTFLTMLGIIIGVFSVIVIVSLGQGAKANVTSSIESMGTNVMNISVFSDKVNLDVENLEELESIEGILNLSPEISSYGMVKYGLENIESVKISGVNNSYLNIQNFKLEKGRSLVDVDIEYRNQVALIGNKTADKLFKKFDPVGREIFIQGERYTVVGVLEEKKSSMFGDSNALIFIPYTTAMRKFNIQSIDSIVLQTDTTMESEAVKKEIEDYLTETLKDSESYYIYSQEAMMSEFDKISTMLTLVLGGIAGISLLVGGIGIMNIMLVTVTERTREIGIRKAIGARRINIMIQFLIESSVISCMGGFIGTVLGIIANNIICGFIGIEPVVNIQVIAASFGFSLFVGVFFGVYPAGKASKLKPVDALRYE
jgi:putative ABC transport system permease protein